MRYFFGTGCGPSSAQFQRSSQDHGLGRAHALNLTIGGIRLLSQLIKVVINRLKQFSARSRALLSLLPVDNKMEISSESER